LVIAAIWLIDYKSGQFSPDFRHIASGDPAL